MLHNGGKWRELPERFGRWHTVYTRFSRWAKSGVLTRVFQRLQEEQLIDQAVLGLDGAGSSKAAIGRIEPVASAGATSDHPSLARLRAAVGRARPWPVLRPLRPA